MDTYSIVDKEFDRINYEKCMEMKFCSLCEVAKSPRVMCALPGE